jgi:hypothetical protein
VGSKNEMTRLLLDDAPHSIATALALGAASSCFGLIAQLLLVRAAKCSDIGNRTSEHALCGDGRLFTDRPDEVEEGQVVRSICRVRCRHRRQAVRSGQHDTSIIAPLHDNATSIANPNDGHHGVSHDLLLGVSVA